MPDSHPQPSFPGLSPALGSPPVPWLESVPAAAYTCDTAGKLTAFNLRAAQLWGRTPKLNDADDRHYGPVRLFAADGVPLAPEESWLAKAIDQNRPFHDHEVIIERSDGERRSVASYASPLHDEFNNVIGGMDVLIDITERNRSEAVLHRQNRVLERIAGDASATETLEEIVDFVEYQIPGSLCSILLFDDKQQRLRFGAGKSLPPAYNAALDGIPIGPRAGSCATTAFHGQTTIVSNIAVDPLWADYRESALGFGLQSCWSIPIFARSLADQSDRKRRVLGTVALYKRQVSTPTVADLEVVTQAAHLAGIALERDDTDRMLRDSEDRFRQLANSAFEGLVVHESGVVLDANRTFLELFGVQNSEELIGKQGLDVLPLAPESKALIRERLAAPRDDVAEIRSIRADGSHRVLEMQSRNIVYRGRPAHVAALRDVTERRRSEEQLRAGQVHLMASQRIAQVGSWELDLSQGAADATPLRWSDEAYRIFGYSPDETTASRKAFWDRVHPEDRAKIAEAMKRAIQTRSVYELEHRIVLPGGEERIIHERGELETNPTTGAPLKIVGTSRDVTEYRRNEAQLRNSAAQHRLLTEHAHVVLWEGDTATFRFTYVSEFAERLLGYPRETWYEDGFWFAHIHPDDRDAAMALCKEYTAARKDHRFEYRMIRADGSVIWVEDVVNSIGDGDTTAVRGVLIDITERKDAERKLVDAVRSKAEALALLDALYTKAPIGLAFIDSQFRFVRCNDALAEINGRSAAEHLGRTAEEIIPLLWKQLEPLYRGVLAGNGAVTHHEISGTVASSPGEIRHWLTSFYPVTIGDEILGIGVIVSEITERKRMEEALRVGEARHRAILDALPDQMFRVDSTGRIFDFHAANHINLYAPPEAFLNRNVEEVLPGDVGRLIQANIRETLETGQAQVFEYDLEMPPRGTLSFEARMAVSGKNEAIAIVRDVTERKRLEEQLGRSQKLEAVGRLAGGVAHDFNNLLTVVNGYSQLLLEKTTHTPSTSDALTAIHDAGRRAATLVRQLLAFSRGQAMQPVVLDLNDVLAQVENLLRRMLDDRIQLKICREEALKSIVADRSQIEQVVLNLVVNARDAMPQAGTIKLQTRNVELSSRQAETLDEVAPGRYVQLTVTDDGCGMSPDILSHLFEPFYTTKPVGKGTGLGLAVVHGIVKQSGGHIQIASRIGEGTTATILFPAAPD